MLNGTFQDSLKSLFDKKQNAIDRMQVIFPKDFKKDQIASTNTLSALDHVCIAYQSEWPLEIILDQDTIMNQYN